MLPVSGEQHLKARDEARDRVFAPAWAADELLAAYFASLAAQGVRLVVRQKCARDSDWCDGAICRRPPHGNGMFPDCPNADPVPADTRGLVDVREVAEWLREVDPTPFCAKAWGPVAAIDFLRRFGGGDER